MFTLDPIQNLKDLVLNQDLLGTLTTKPSVDLGLLKSLLMSGSYHPIENLLQYHHSDNLSIDRSYASARRKRINKELNNDKSLLYTSDPVGFWERNDDAIKEWLGKYSQPKENEPKLTAVIRLLNSTRYDMDQTAFSDDQVAHAIYGDDFSNDCVRDVIKTIIRTLIVSILDLSALANNGHEYEGISEHLIGFIGVLGSGRFFTSNDHLVKVFLNKFDAIAFHDAAIKAVTNKTELDLVLDEKELIGFFEQNQKALINWMDELKLDFPPDAYRNKIDIVVQHLNKHCVEISYDDVAVAMYSSDPKDLNDDVSLAIAALFAQGLSGNYKAFLGKRLDFYK